MYAERMTTDAYKAASTEIDTVIIPVGSLEAHGRHCPLGTDMLIPERLCRDLESRLGDRIIIAPPVNYGYTPVLSAFPGSVSINAETLIALYTGIGAAFAKWGAKNIVFMNGHGGNIPMLTVACDRIAETGATAAAIGWWLTFSKDILGICSSQGHAGEDETSLVLAIDATLVDGKAISKHMKKSFMTPLAGPDQRAAKFPDAMNGDAARADAGKGERLYAMLLDKNIEYIERIRRGDYTDAIE